MSDARIDLWLRSPLWNGRGLRTANVDWRAGEGKLRGKCRRYEKLRGRYAFGSDWFYWRLRVTERNGKHSKKVFTTDSHCYRSAEIFHP
jgi:hypothetical protein